MIQVIKFILSLAFIGLICADVGFGVEFGALILGVACISSLRPQLFKLCKKPIAFPKLYGFISYFVAKTQQFIACGIEFFISFKWRVLGLRFGVAIFLLLAYRYPFFFMANLLEIPWSIYLVFSAVSFTLSQFIISELLNVKLSNERLVNFFLTSILVGVICPTVMVLFLSCLPNWICLLLRDFINGLCLISEAQAEGDGSSSEDRGRYRDRSEPSDNNNRRRRSASPLPRRPSPSHLPLPYQYRSPTEPRIVLPPISLGQVIQPGERVQLPSIRQTVQLIPPMGPAAPQRVAVLDGPVVTERAMAGVGDYLPVGDLFGSDIALNAYNSAETWYRSSLHLNIFSGNQMAYRSRLMLVIDETLVNRFNREKGMETTLAAHRLASYYFKMMYDRNNNFLN